MGGRPLDRGFIGVRLLLQCDARLPDVAESLPRIALETALQQMTHRGWHRLWQPSPVDVLANDSGEHVSGIRACKQLTTGDHLVQHHAERPDIGALVHRLPAGLLGSHVGGGAEDETRLRGVHREGWRVHRVGIDMTTLLDGLREAKIQNLDHAVRTQFDIRGLQIAMDDPVIVCRLERAGDLTCNCAGFVQRHRPTRDTLGERRPLNQFEYEGKTAWRLLQPVDGTDVRIVERRKQLRLPLETGKPFGCTGDRRGEHLDRHVTLQLRVASTVDLAHPSDADELAYLVRAEPRAGTEGHLREQYRREQTGASPGASAGLVHLAVRSECSGGTIFESSSWWSPSWCRPLDAPST